MEDIEIIRSDRRTMCIQIKNDMRIIVRVPLYARDKDIQSFINSHIDWITESMEKIRQKQANTSNVQVLDNEQIKNLSQRAKSVISDRVEYFAELMELEYEKITIRSQKSRWGSCSGKKNLNFNCLLMLCPPEVLDYVVVHELCHLRQMNHSARFWSEVERYCPQYKVYRKWLKTDGEALIRLLP